jgi:hypothetical protein
MASPTITPTDTARCGRHHGPATLCLTAELGDLLPSLQARGATITITAPLPFLDACMACEDQPREAVAVVAHTNPTDPAHRGFRYLEPTCLLCIDGVVAYEVAQHNDVTVEVPARIGTVA